MRYALNIPAFGDFADPRALAELAQEAEGLGWDGFFIWDHMVFDPSWHPMLDPWVGLAAVAMRTHTMRIGTLLTPMPRRRPWKVAREAMTLDLLSNGRMTLGVGIGDPAQFEYGFFGEPTDAKIRAEMLDESLQVLDGLWSGKPFSFSGKHYQLHEMVFLPKPIQQPRIPIWVGGWWPNKPPMRRAARWDGYFPGKWGDPITPAEWGEIIATIAQHRTSQEPFDLVAGGVTKGRDPASVALTAEYAAAGCSWWVENISPWSYGIGWEEPWSAEASELMRVRVRQGPPRA